MRKQCSAAVLAGCSDRRTTVSGFRLDLTLRRDDEAHLAVEGPVGSVETRRIATLVQALLAAGARQLIVDLDLVESCDPALTALPRAAAAPPHRGRRLDDRGRRAVHTGR